MGVQREVMASVDRDGHLVIARVVVGAQTVYEDRTDGLVATIAVGTQFEGVLDGFLDELKIVAVDAELEAISRQPFESCWLWCLNCIVE